jgi:hypothetical protein
VNDITSIKLENKSYFSLKEYSYFILARKIAFNNRHRNGGQPQAAASIHGRDSVKRMFSRQSYPNNNNLDQQTERSNGKNLHTRNIGDTQRASA